MNIKVDEVLEKVINFINERNDIRAAILEGSRCNPNVLNDKYQDYDVALFVNEPNVFLDDQSWIKTFGEILIMQLNPSEGENLLYKEVTENLTFLMLFKEGFRIDFGFFTIDKINDFLNESLCYVLVDKDQVIKSLPKPSDQAYWVKKPVKAEFDFVVNEFWWCLTNVAKGLYREEFPYVKGMYETVVKPVYLNMISWYIGMNYDWKVNLGKFNKWIKNYLSDDMYNLFIKSYSGSNYDEIWDSIFAAGKLFRQVSQELAFNLNFIYPIKDDENVIEYLKLVREDYNIKDR